VKKILLTTTALTMLAGAAFAAFDPPDRLVVSMSAESEFVSAARVMDDVGLGTSLEIVDETGRVAKLSGALEFNPSVALDILGAANGAFKTSTGTSLMTLFDLVDGGDDPQASVRIDSGSWMAALRDFGGSMATAMYGARMALTDLVGGALAFGFGGATQTRTA